MLRGEAEGKTGPGFAVSAEGCHDASKKIKKNWGLLFLISEKNNIFALKDFNSGVEGP